MAKQAKKAMSPAERLAALHNKALPNKSFEALHVTTAVEGFAEGDTLTTLPVARKYFVGAAKLVAPESANVLDALNNEQLDAMIFAVKGDNADANNQRILNIVGLAPADEPIADLTSVESVTARNIHAEALSMGKKLSAAANKVFEFDINESQEKFIGSVLRLADILETDFRDANGDDDTVNWPRPGTWPPGTTNNRGVKDVLPVGTNERSDHWEIGKDKGSWYADVFDGSTYGAPIAEVVNIFRRKGREKRDFTADEKARILEVTKEPEQLLLGRAVASVDRRWSGRRNACIGKLRLAQDLRLQKNRALTIDGLSVQYVGSADPDWSLDHAANKKQPIEIYYSAEKDGRKVLDAFDKPVSVQQFLNYDFEEAKLHMSKGMGVIAAIKKTAEKSTRTPASKIPQNPSMEMVGAMVTAINNYFSDNPAADVQFGKWMNNKNVGELNRAAFNELLGTLGDKYAEFKGAIEQDVMRREQAAKEKRAS